MNIIQKAFVFIGVSGCGKGTQIDLLKKYIDIKYKGRRILEVQTGGDFREFIKGDGYTNRLSKNIYDKGGIQPAFLATHIWSHSIIKYFDEESDLVLDGSPRTYPEALVMDSVFKFYSIEKPNIIHIDISREESIKRLLNRKRFDDNIDDINARLDFYYKDVVPVVDFYRNNEFYNFVELNGERSIEDIHAEIIAKTIK